MAIIYTYPSGTPSASDNIIGTQVDPITEENKTVQFGIQAVSYTHLTLPTILLV